MTGSFAISIILFLGFSIFVDFMHRALKPLQPYTPDISIASSNQSRTVDPSLAGQIAEMDGVKRVYGRSFLYELPAEYDGQEVAVTVISYEENQFHWVKENHWASGESLKKVTDNTEELYVLAGYNGGRPLPEGARLSTANGDLIVAGTLYDCPFDRGKSDWTLICSEETFSALAGESGYTILDIQLDRSADDDDVNAIRQLAGGYAFSDQRLSNREVAGAFYSFALFVYGFLAIIALIAACNIINSISMSVSARIRQYGAMRAVGMEIPQLIRMIGAETFVYAVCGILCGSVVGLPLHHFLWQLFIFDRWKEHWQFPAGAFVVIIAVIILSGTAAVYGPAKRIREMSVVDVISHE